jgi:hypothetical protein
MKFSTYILLGLLFFTTVLSCSKKKWDKTSSGALRVELLENFSSDDFSVAVSSFNLTTKTISLKGSRLQAEPVEIIISQNANLDFKSGGIQNQLTFNIPQGTYTSLNLDLTLENATQNIQISGVFNDVSESKHFIVQLDYLDLLNLIAINLDGSELFLVDADKQITATISCKTEHIFANTTQTLWNSSIPDFVTNVVTISPTSNPSLYSSFLEQISQSFEFIID